MKSEVKKGSILSNESYTGPMKKTSQKRRFSYEKTQKTNLDLNKLV